MPLDQSSETPDFLDERSDAEIEADTHPSDADPVDSFAAGVLDAPWGMLSRTQTDYLIFRLFAQTGRVNVGSSDFEIANALRTTVTRVRALRYRYDQERVAEGVRALDTLLTAENFAFEDASAGKIRVSIRSRYLRELFAAHLSDKGEIVLSELTPSTLLVTPLAFTEEIVSLGVSTSWLETAEGQRAHNDLFTRLAKAKSEQEARSAAELWRSGVPQSVSLASGLITILQAVGPFLAGR